MPIMAEDTETKGIPGPNDRFQSETPPSTAYILWFTAQADVSSADSIFHRLGFRENDAAPGNHVHDGRKSAFLFDAATDVIGGDLSTAGGLQTAVREIARLLAKLGATNNTTN